jgi:hypothetical protein
VYEPDRRYYVEMLTVIIVVGVRGMVGDISYNI